MSNERPNPNEPHVFQEVMLMPVTTATVAPLDSPGATYAMPPTPISRSPQCGVCHRAKDDRLHIAAEANDSEQWPL